MFWFTPSPLLLVVRIANNQLGTCNKILVPNSHLQTTVRLVRCHNINAYLLIGIGFDR